MTDRVLRSLLRPSEFVRVILEGRSVPRREEADSEAKEADATLDEKAVVDQGEYDVLLAVVGHLDKVTGESGSVFIYREEDPSSSGRRTLILQHIFPIHKDFSLGISQLDPQNDTADGDVPRSPTTTLPDPGFSMELSDGKSVPFTLVTYDKEHLSTALLACRNLREASLKHSSDTEFHPWLAPYALHPSSWLSVIPPRDLRYSTQPAHHRLSSGCAGLPGDEIADFMTLRDEWLYTKAQHTVQRDPARQGLRVRVGTFNVNGKMPSQDLSAWIGGLSGDEQVQDEWKHLIPPIKEISPLSLGESGKTIPETGPATAEPPIHGSADPDLFVLAFQELDLSTEALLYSTKTTRKDAWTTAVIAALGDKGELYEKLASKQLVGMFLIVLVRKELRSNFVGARTGAVGAGIMGIMGNKGAVALRLTYRPEPTPSTPIPIAATLTFVNAHLAAFDEMLERRNGDFRDISRRLEFGPCAEYMWDSPLDPDAPSEPPMLNIYSSDLLVWMVSLPTGKDMSQIDIVMTCNQGVPTLLKFDQLKSSMRNKKAFEGFKEHTISHLPTYRFQNGILTDKLGYDMKRKPAWTDRVLHMTSPFVPVHQLSYASHPEVSMSDHKPVSADFIVEIPVVDTMDLETVANELYKSIASIDPEELTDMPVLKLDETTVDFEKVSYDRPTSKNLVLRNTGKVPAAFRFFPREIEKPITPEWLQISPLAGFLLAGEDISITFTVHVTSKSAATLNLGTAKLSTLIILHTTLGQDLFISLGGQYESTCFGNSLSVLARLPGPIRELQGEDALLPQAQARNSSRELMKLIGWLMSNDVDAVDGLFVTPGDESLIAQIRECLDTNADFPATPEGQDVDTNLVRAMATALLMFLDSLPEPVIPSHLHAHCAGITSRDAAYEMLSVFPPVSVNVWISVTAFLHLLAYQAEQRASAAETKAGDSAEEDSEDVRTAVETDSTPSRAEQLASIFAPVLLRDDIEAAAPVSLVDKRRFLLYFMQG
ncbi:DNase I-like protein [Artomyces pyxidatus]|uniref:DNase I-like protein n=1 Tax=Artomyces pyxidatus TaxID=48021 RepID=A0ACB8SZI3_9AGAM|nr:DNase I-like protein [Artomyces pyxidatus]